MLAGLRIQTEAVTALRLVPCTVGTFGRFGGVRTLTGFLNRFAPVKRENATLCVVVEQIGVLTLHCHSEMWVPAGKCHTPWPAVYEELDRLVQTGI